MKNIAIKFLMLLSLASVAHAASFDCAKASTPIEKTICGDTLLGQLDDALGENYKSMSHSNIGDGAINDLKTSQRSWMKERNKCADKKCLEESYRKRIDAVCDYPVIKGSHPSCIDSDSIGVEIVKVQAPVVRTPAVSGIVNNEPLVIITNPTGIQINACAEAYGLRRGLFEIAHASKPHREQLETIMGGIPLKEQEKSADLTADQYVLVGLISAKLREAKRGIGPVILAELSSASKSGRGVIYSDKLWNDLEKYQDICNRGFKKVSGIK